jgi:hypothetical protein
LTAGREEVLAAREAEQGEDQQEHRHENGAGALDGVHAGPEVWLFLGASEARSRAMGEV